MRHRLLASSLLALLVMDSIGSLCLAQEGYRVGAFDLDERPYAVAAATSTSFSFQGNLVDGDVPIDGTCDFVFALWDAATLGKQVGSDTQNGVLVAGGVFSVLLDFGASAFTGEARWLETAVTCVKGSPVVLRPRQPVTAAPYALGLRPGSKVDAAVTGPALTLVNTSGFGLEVSSGGADGIRVTDAASNGVNVNHASSDGFFVCSTGSAASCLLSSENNGVEVGNAEDNGIFVKAAGNDGVVVSSAADDGVYVNTATDDGLHVGQVANSDGLQIDFALNGHGVNVLNAGNTGFHVEAVAGDGFSVCRTGTATSCTPVATNSGLEVGSAQDYGVHVNDAGNDGVHVTSAGDHGVYVGTTTDAGLYVNAAGSDGVYVNSSGGDGVRVNSAGQDGVEARTSTLTAYGGRFSNGAGGGAALYAIGGGNDAADLVLGGTSGGDDGRIYSQPDLSESDILLFSNDNLHIHLDEDNNNTSSGFVIYNGADTPVWSVSESGVVATSEGSVALVDAGAGGKQQVYPVHSPQNWLEDFGGDRLVAGEAVVRLDDEYARLISTDRPYHIFLTPLGDCPLYVAEKGSASFTVRAQGGASCGIGFDYRVVGLRAGYEAVRLETYAPVLPVGD